MRSGLDRADLVCIAALASADVAGDPVAVLASSDLELLRLISERAADAPTAYDAAAVLLVGIAAGRPFASANRAAAWLAAVHLLDREGVTVVAEHDDVRRLLTEAAEGRVDDPHAAAFLLAASRRGGRFRRWLAGPPRRTYDCQRPGCVRCEIRRRTPETVPVTRPVPDDGGWCPVLRSGDAVLVLADSGTFALRPVDAGYAVHAVPELAPGDLVGTWDALWDRTDVIGWTAGATFDDAGRIQWAGTRIERAEVPA